MHPASIGPFQIERELGRGGMGVVLLAMDTRLVRRVAIKSLPDQLAADPQRLARFQREARVLASLSHPGIGAIYGLEESGGNHYLVLEFVEGETLAHRLDRGAMPVEASLTIARKIAEALEAAHDKGVIHRDLKPANVMLTPEDEPKVLDFGLARTDDHPSSVHGAFTPDSPTLAAPASPTLAGVVVGSPGYMSPEQALGKTVDKRSDVFAFGCVLFEMLTGERTFHGENAAAALGAVLHVEPDWAALPAPTPPRIRELLASTLHKDRRQRLHDIGDARLALERAIQGREWTLAASKGALSPSRARAWIRWTVAAATAVAAAVSLWHARAPAPVKPGPSAPVRLRIDDASAPPSLQTDNGGISISPDGALVAYVADRGTGLDLTLRRLDAFKPEPLGLTASDVVVSPDGKRVAYVRGHIMYVVPASGGEPARVYEGELGVVMKGAAWSPQGIVLSPTPTSGLVLIPEGAGQPRTLAVPDASRNEISHRWPEMLPDGRRLLMTVKKSDIRTFDDAEIAILDLDKGTWKTIIRGGCYARYVPTGHIVFARNASIMAVPFDLAAGEVTGTPVAVVNGVMMSPGSGAARFAIARDAGTLVYIPGGLDEEQKELLWIDMQGKIEPVGAPIMPYVFTSLSPDGTRIVSSVYGASDAVFVYDVAKRTNTRVTFRGNCTSGAWMPDGTHIVYVSDGDGPPALYMTSADGSGKAEKVLDMGARGPREVALVQGQPASVYAEGGDIWLQPLRSAERQKLIGTPFQEGLPHVSPDGKWLSYTSNESGQDEIYVRPFPSGDGRWQVSRGGGGGPWAPDGSAIFWLGSEMRVYRASFRTDPARGVEIGVPQLIFTMPPGLGIVLEPHPDGKRFLAARDLPPRFRADQVCVVLNWFDELKAKVPAGSK